MLPLELLQSLGVTIVSNTNAATFSSETTIVCVSSQVGLETNATATVYVPAGKSVLIFGVAPTLPIFGS